MLSNNNVGGTLTSTICLNFLNYICSEGITRSTDLNCDYCVLTMILIITKQLCVYLRVFVRIGEALVRWKWYWLMKRSLISIYACFNKCLLIQVRRSQPLTFPSAGKSNSFIYKYLSTLRSIILWSPCQFHLLLVCNYY